MPTDMPLSRSTSKVFTISIQPSALGFSLVIVLFAGMRERLEQTAQPALFKGAPLSFITAGILAMAFAGFAGLAG